MNQIDYDRLSEIRQEMMDLLEEASTLIRQEDKNIHARAKAYWIGNIDVSLGGGKFMDTYSHTFEKTLNEISVDEDEDDDEYDDEEDEFSETEAPIA
jgi:hypothetical protein